jgi:type I restriction enzyme S subunit
MRTKNVQEVLDESDIVWIPASIIRNSSKYLKTGDILVSSANSWNLVGKGCWVPKLSYPASAGGFISILRGNQAFVDLRYLYHWFMSPQTQAKLRSYSNKTTNISNLDHSRTLGTELPLPPLEEQRRIAVILDKVQETLSLQRSCLQDLTASLELNLFIDLLGSPATNPKGWDLARIGDLAEIFSDGPFGSNLKSSHYTESGVRIIRLQNIGVREFVDNDKAFVSNSHYEELSKHTCLPGDVLIGTLGDPNLRACIQPHHIPISINKADCVQMRCAESVAHPLFIMHLLNTPDANAMASSLILGQTRGRISMGRLRGLSIPVPPVELQAEFASRVERAESLKQSLRSSFAEVDQLKGALSHSFFQEE